MSKITDLQRAIAEYLKHNYTVTQQTYVQTDAINLRISIWPKDAMGFCDVSIYPSVTHMYTRGQLRFHKIIPHSDPDYFQLIHGIINGLRPLNRKFVKDVEKYVLRKEKGK